ncbi:MAG TPA: hypothetical protein VM532_18445 [Burkholderiales bacterium]|nr:hypothetical protein [Burkholderiales bacterium]
MYYKGEGKYLAREAQQRAERQRGEGETSDVSNRNHDGKYSQLFRQQQQK